MYLLFDHLNPLWDFDHFPYIIYLFLFRHHTFVRYNYSPCLLATHQSKTQCDSQKTYRRSYLVRLLHHSQNFEINILLIRPNNILKQN